MKFKLLAILVAISALSASAEPFFSTAAPARLFSFGVRVGVNTSNQTVNKDVFNQWNMNSWGTGFTAGVVVPINFRDFFAIEPGFFYESRSGDYAYAQTIPNPSDPAADPSNSVQLGHYRNYNFTIPILAKVRFNISNSVKWSLDFGPYVNWKLATKGDQFSTIPDGVAADREVADDRNFGFGFKFGTSLTLLKHIHLGVHYNAGATRVWKQEEMGGRNKAWTFSAGWDF